MKPRQALGTSFIVLSFRRHVICLRRPHKENLNTKVNLPFVTKIYDREIDYLLSHYPGVLRLTVTRVFASGHSSSKVGRGRVVQDLSLLCLSDYPSYFLSLRVDSG